MLGKIWCVFSSEIQLWMFLCGHIDQQSGICILFRGIYFFYGNNIIVFSYDHQKYNDIVCLIQFHFIQEFLKNELYVFLRNIE